MSDTPEARRALDALDGDRSPEPAGPSDDDGPPEPETRWGVDDEVDHDPLVEVRGLVGLARKALREGVVVPDEARLRPVKQAVVRAVRPVTTAQHDLDEPALDALAILAEEAAVQRERTNRLIAGMANLDLALDAVDVEVRDLRREVAALRAELAEVREGPATR